MEQGERKGNEGDEEDEEDKEDVEDEDEENEESKLKWKFRILPNCLFNCMVQLPKKTYSFYMFHSNTSTLFSLYTLIFFSHSNKSTYKPLSTPTGFGSTRLNSTTRLYAQTQLSRMSQMSI
ncbi:hypothetical protein JCGZ_20942 [Jatropha curcas]|uniref:Uncharacterized protein n=1 Tax=Jatropha curcas TaxID=180498 RepID=A0A067K4F6_JATCU|nr:hypothetical protein JCGZ_20942 [Jatropha curcas]